MKKYLALLMTIVILINVAGCAHHKSYRLPGRSDVDIVENQIEALIDAIEDEDVDAIIDMFSEDALDEIDDMDEFEEDIEELIATFPDWDGDYENIKIREYNHRSYKSDDYYCYSPDIKFEADGEEYQLHLVMIYNTQNEDLLGLRVIQICDEDCNGYITNNFNRRPGIKREPGVYCWDYGVN